MSFMGLQSRSCRPKSRNVTFLFYTLLLFFLAPDLRANGNPNGYSSDMLKGAQESKTNVYYARHLENLKKEVKPRYIHLIDTRYSLQQSGVMNSGVLFTYKNYHARQVYFTSNLDQFKKHPMIRNENGVWYFLLKSNEYMANKPGNEIRYKFVVDGLYIHDTTHDSYVDDNAGGLISLYYLTQEMMEAQEGVMQLQSETQQNRRVLFRVYAPTAGYVTLVSSFNNWDSELGVMHKSENGYFEFEISLPAGEYTYLYRIDGQAMIDPENLELRYHPVFGRVSYFSVETDEGQAKKKMILSRVGK